VSALWLQAKTDKLARSIIAVVVLGNLVFVVGASLLHALYWRIGLTDLLPMHFSAFDVGHERGIPETFNYLQILATAGLLLATAYVTRQWTYVVWGLIFVFALADDFFMLHEKAGEADWATSYLPHVFVAPEEVGASLFWAAGGLVLFGLLGLALHTASRQARAFSIVLFGAFSIFVFFGIGVDALQGLGEEISSRAGRLFVVIEDGGEILAMGLCLALSLLLFRLTSLRSVSAEKAAW
jgi:hypothetical protein